MSSFLCFLCHSTVNADTNEEIREKYREVVGMHLCMDSHLCYICCHVLNKLWLFRAVCLKRSLEYPVLFSEKGTLNLQRNDLEIQAICFDDTCGQYHNRNMHSKLFRISYVDVNTNQSQEHTNNKYADVDKQYADVDNQYADVDNQYADGNKQYADVDNQYADVDNQFADADNRYVKLEDDRTDYDEYFYQEEVKPEQETAHKSNVENYKRIHNGQECSTKDEKETEYIFYGKIENVTEGKKIENVTEGENIIINDQSGHNLEEYTHTETEKSEHKDRNKISNETIVKENIQYTKEIEHDVIVKKKKSKKRKKKGFEKIVLSLEEQKAELDRRRKEKKYLESEFKCYNCALGFLFKDTYQAHMMRHEESNGEYRCVTCTLRFATPAVLRAHNANHAERYACGACGTRVGGRARRTHARACAADRGEGVACHLCGGIFTDGAGLQQHLKRFHQTKTSTRTYPCAVCGKTYTNQAAVRTHMIKHINRKFDCGECISTFSSPYTLAQHKRRKHGGTTSEQYYCEICNIGYSSRKSLLAHKRNALNHQQTVFECPICSRMCPNQRSLSSHVESVHSGSKNYSCPVCAARYSNRKSLVRHIGSHQGKGAAKTVVCHLCGASFKGNNKLNRHIREVCEKVKLEEGVGTLYVQDCLNPASYLQGEINLP